MQFYKYPLQDLNIDDFQTTWLQLFKFHFHIKTTCYDWWRDLNIINSTSLRDVLAQGPKYSEPKSINWKHDFEIPIEIQLYNGDTIFTSNFFSNEQLIFLQLWVTCSDVYIKIIFSTARYSSESSQIHIWYGCLEWNDYVKFKSFFLYRMSYWNNI